MKINNFWGDLSDISAKTATLPTFHPPSGAPFLLKQHALSFDDLRKITYLKHEKGLLSTHRTLLDLPAGTWTKMRAATPRIKTIKTNAAAI